MTNLPKRRPSPRLRWAGPAATLALASACSRATVSEPEPEPAPPSVLLVVLDTVRADAVSSQGSLRPTTPQLDLLASRGVQFDAAYTSSTWSWPSHASLFTGLPPWEHGANAVSDRPDAPKDAVSALRSDVPTLAEQLRAHGYQTVGFTENRWLDTSLGLPRGFETMAFQDEGCAATARQLEAAVGGTDRPTFAFVNLMSAHGPYRRSPAPWLSDVEPPPPELVPFVSDDLSTIRVLASKDGRPPLAHAVLDGTLVVDGATREWIRAYYDGGVLAADYCLNKVVDAWLRAAPRGAIVVTSDHGESFGEHGMFEHAHVPFRPVVHVPLVVVQPGVTPPDTRVAAPVSVDLVAPTILELAGAEPGRQPTLLDIARGAPAAARVSALHIPDEANKRFPRLVGPSYFVREGDWAAVWSATERHLFDAAGDPLMTTPVDDPDRLQAMIASAEPGFSLQVETPLIVPGGEVHEQLRALGYVDAPSAP